VFVSESLGAGAMCRIGVAYYRAERNCVVLLGWVVWSDNSANAGTALQRSIRETLAIEFRLGPVSQLPRP
jgi:hypothetical protein